MTSVGSILLLRTDQIIVHGPCTNHQCRFYRITSTKLFAIQTILPLRIHAIGVNYSLKALWHLPNYVSNLCIVESWLRRVKAALDYLFIHWLNPVALNLMSPTCTFHFYFTLLSPSFFHHRTSCYARQEPVPERASGHGLGAAIVDSSCVYTRPA